jgi:hypothetical protein
MYVCRYVGMHRYMLAKMLLGIKLMTNTKNQMLAKLNFDEEKSRILVKRSYDAVNCFNRSFLMEIIFVSACALAECLY